MKTLIYLSSSPYSSLALKEGLDLALVLGTFEQKVSICLTGDAITLLHQNQAPTALHGKHLYKLLDGLEFYDIENIYIKQGDCNANQRKLWKGVIALNESAWTEMLAEHTHVFRF